MQDLFRHLRIHTASKRCETCALYECVVEECNCICHKEDSNEEKEINN